MPPKRKQGLSADEKCDRVAKYLRRRPEPFTMKDLEKDVPKAVPGLDFRAIPELIENLVAEGIIASAKVSVTTLYWPAQGSAATLQSPEEILAAIATAKAQHEALDAQNRKVAADLAVLRREHLGDQGEYDALLQYFREKLPAALAEVKAAYASVQERDPEAYAQLCRNIVAIRDSVNRWTDNMMILQQHVQSRCGLSPEEFRRQFNVPRDFDYVLAPPQ